MSGEVLVTPAVDIQVAFGADGARAFTVRFAPLPLDMTKVQLDTSLDLVLAAVERQRARYELEDEEVKLAEQLDRIRKYQAGLVSVEESSKAWWEAEGRRGEWGLDKLSPNHRNERERLTIALQNDRQDALARQAKIRRLQAKVNGNGTDGGADRNTGGAEG